VTTAASAHDPVVVGPGRLVAIGGRRALYLECEGSGNPTVILEAGFPGTSENWSDVQPALGRATRTCSYDRAGLGSSPPIPGVHTAADEISDLKRLLDHAGIPPPYVLVGHSYGGLLMRLFAHAHPQLTAGIVLVDAMGHNQDQRFLRILDTQPASVRQQLQSAVSNPISSGLDMYAGEALDARVTKLGDVPLVVITRGRNVDLGVSLPASLQRPVTHLWAIMQHELAGLSVDSVHVTALRSGHFVQSSPDGQPDVVIAAVLAVVHAARTHAHLPACSRLFGSPAARCDH
jgi:pimeloyl-ACP methyl ester carboxylesterase